jgi:uncharacterized repeat protein (TIGR03803 family)
MHRASSLLRLFAMPILATVFASCPAWAQGSYSIIYSFNGNNGSAWQPWSGVVVNPGMVIGTTEQGGAYGYGTVYALLQTSSRTWSYQTMHSFSSSDNGAAPTTALVQDASYRLYGTGAEQIFQLSPTALLSRKFSPVYNFTGGNDGDCSDLCSVSIDTAGNLYGSTPQGGADGAGVVFKVDSSGYSVIYTFTGGSDGGWGIGPVAIDAQGNVYGTADQGGAYGMGVVYRLSPTGDPSTYTYSKLHDFSGGDDGAGPWGGIILGHDGNLYGTTESAGSGYGGTVFQMTPNGDGTWSESVIHAFAANGTDGYQPLAPPTMDNAGNLYGTTVEGSSSHGFGTVYKLTNSNGNWTESIVHDFQGEPSDGSGPFGPVTIDGSGNIFGTTQQGGVYSNGGTVWEISALQK